MAVDLERVEKKGLFSLFGKNRHPVNERLMQAIEAVPVGPGLPAEADAGEEPADEGEIWAAGLRTAREEAWEKKREEYGQEIDLPRIITSREAGERVIYRSPQETAKQIIEESEGKEKERQKEERRKAAEKIIILRERLIMVAQDRLFAFSLALGRLGIREVLDEIAERNHLQDGGLGDSERKFPAAAKTYFEACFNGLPAAKFMTLGLGSPHSPTTLSRPSEGLESLTDQQLSEEIKRLKVTLPQVVPGLCLAFLGWTDKKLVPSRKKDEEPVLCDFRNCLAVKAGRGEKGDYCFEVIAGAKKVPKNFSLPDFNEPFIYEEDLLKEAKTMPVAAVLNLNQRKWRAITRKSPNRWLLSRLNRQIGEMMNSAYRDLPSYFSPFD